MRALLALTLANIRSYVRDRAALFWTLAFPVLLSTGLGVAFRNQPAEIVRIGAVTADLAASLGQDARLRVEELTPDAVQ